MDLLPAVEAASLAQGADSIWEGMVHIVEEHLIPAMLASQDEGHDVVQDRPGAARVVGQELVPRERVCEIGDEHPCSRIATTSKEGHGEHEAPAFRKVPAKWPCAQHPHTSPQAKHKEVVLYTAGHPFGPKLLVALAAGTFIW